MNEKHGDPIGEAIRFYAATKKPADIIVSSDICEDDIIPMEVMFRTYNDMPELEKMALNLCRGEVLDVGAGAGVHSLELHNKGIQTNAIDLSQGAVDYMQSKGIKARKLNFFDLKNEKYDTILMLMNGIGIAGKLSNLEHTLLHGKSLLKDGGKILCDSSDIRYLYEDEDGSMWIDLNSEYCGNCKKCRPSCQTSIRT